MRYHREYKTLESLGSDAFGVRPDEAPPISVALRDGKARLTVGAYVERRGMLRGRLAPIDDLQPWFGEVSGEHNLTLR